MSRMANRRSLMSMVIEKDPSSSPIAALMALTGSLYMVMYLPRSLVTSSLSESVRKVQPSFMYFSLSCAKLVMSPLWATATVPKLVMTVSG